MLRSVSCGSVFQPGVQSLSRSCSWIVLLWAVAVAFAVPPAVVKKDTNKQEKDRTNKQDDDSQKTNDNKDPKDNTFDLEDEYYDLEGF